jgi:hypothetical protein
VTERSTEAKKRRKCAISLQAVRERHADLSNREIITSFCLVLIEFEQEFSDKR